MSASLPHRTPSRHLTLVQQRSHLRAVPPLDDADAARAPSVIPEPELNFLRLLAVQGYEVLIGARALGRLTPLITVGLARSLSAQRARLEVHLRFRGLPSTAPVPGTVQLSRPSPDVAEAAVLLHFGTAVCATAIRLEWTHRHWRATELVVL